MHPNGSSGLIAIKIRGAPEPPAALAFDNGQYQNVPADIRTWLKGVIAPNSLFPRMRCEFPKRPIRVGHPAAMMISSSHAI
jgi:hypothetical protein